MSFDLHKAEQINDGIYKTAIDGLYFVEKSFHEDGRGFFSEIGRIPEVESISGKQFTIKQINHARSVKNVIRGIHA